MEINPLGVLHEFSCLIRTKFPNSDIVTVGTAVEKLYAEKLLESFESILDEFVPEDDDEICIPEQISYHEEEDDDSEEEAEEDTKPHPWTSKQKDVDYVSPTQTKRTRGKEVSYERKKAIVELWAQHPKWNWMSVKRNGCPEVPNERTLYNWRKQITGGSSKLVKLREISKFVFDEMMAARAMHKIIRTSHIRNFAIQKFIQLKDENFENFKASRSWLNCFKLRHKITSRKVTRLVTKREVKSEQEIIDSLVVFNNLC